VVLVKRLVSDVEDVEDVEDEEYLHKRVIQCSDVGEKVAVGGVIHGITI